MKKGKKKCLFPVSCILDPVFPGSGTDNTDQGARPDTTKIEKNSHFTLILLLSFSKMFFLPIFVGLRMYKIYLTICNRQKIKYEKKKEMFTACKIRIRTKANADLPH
jgi:hypothetical protein